MSQPKPLGGPFFATTVALAALGGCFTITGVDNRKPTIERIVIASEEALRSGSLLETSVRCVASDPEGDDLSYEWTAGLGSTVTGGQYDNPTSWKLAPPPASGAFTIQCTVSDGQWLAMQVATLYRP